MSKFIFITGGVAPNLGKGITGASLGRMLKGRGHSITIIKLDPYINIDPGTMSPLQHGAVFVTVDGGETDLDLGHYERFMDVELPQSRGRPVEVRVPDVDNFGKPRGSRDISRLGLGVLKSIGLEVRRTGLTVRKVPEEPT